MRFRYDEVRVDWRVLPPGYDCVFLYRGVTVLEGESPAERGRAGTPKPEYRRAEDYIAAGLPVPGVHPTLPVCSPEQMEPDTGREIIDLHVERPVEPTYCQAPRTGIFVPAGR